MIFEWIALAWLIKKIIDSQMRYLSEEDYKRIEDQSCL